MIHQMLDTLDAMPHSTVEWLANYHYHRQKQYTLAECTRFARIATGQITGHVQIFVAPHFYWELMVDDVLMAYGQATDDTAAIDAATLADNKWRCRETA